MDRRHGAVLRRHKERTRRGDDARLRPPECPIGDPLRHRSGCRPPAASQRCLGFLSKQLRKRETKYTAPSTASSWQYTSPCDTSSSSSRADPSRHLQTTSLSPSPWPTSHSPGPAAKRDTSPIYQSTGQTSDTWKASTIRRPTPSPVLISGVNSGVDYSEMARCQQQDADETLAYQTAVTCLRWEDIPIGNSNLTLLCDTSTGRVRPLVPASLRRKVFDTVHGLPHPGANPTVKLISSKFVWHGLSKQVRTWAKTCLDCQRLKVHRHVMAPLETFTVRAVMVLCQDR